MALVAAQSHSEELAATLNNLEQPEELSKVTSNAQAQRIIRKLHMMLSTLKVAIADGGGADEEELRHQHSLLRSRIHTLDGRYRSEISETRLAERRFLLAGASSSGDGDARGSGGSGGLRQRVQAQTSEINKKRDVTASLQRTRQMMADELEKAQAATKVLDEGDATIDGATATLRGYSDDIGASKTLLREFASEDRKERLYLALAVAFFVLTVLYILYARLGKRMVGLVQATGLV